MTTYGAVQEWVQSECETDIIDPAKPYLLVSDKLSMWTEAHPENTYCPLGNSLPP